MQSSSAVLLLSGRVVPVLLALVVAGCSSKPEVSSAPPAVITPAARQALADLRRKLDNARHAAADAHLTTGGDIPADFLLSLNREQVREKLGEPHVCAAADVRGVDNKGSPLAPCEAEGDWFYSFYHLPQGAVGGGPELLLHFDDAGRCIRAGWRLTE